MDVLKVHSKISMFKLMKNNFEIINIEFKFFYRLLSRKNHLKIFIFRKNVRISTRLKHLRIQFIN